LLCIVSRTYKDFTGAQCQAGLKACTTSDRHASREVSDMRATIILVLVFSLLTPPAVFAAGADSPFQQSVARAAQAAGALAQSANGDDGNPYTTPAVV